MDTRHDLDLEPPTTCGVSIVKGGRICTQPMVVMLHQGRVDDLGRETFDNIGACAQHRREIADWMYRTAGDPAGDVVAIPPDQAQAFLLFMADELKREGGAVLTSQGVF